MTKKIIIPIMVILTMASNTYLTKAKQNSTNISNVSNSIDPSTNTGDIHFSNGVSEEFDKNYKLLIVNGNLVDGANIITKNNRTLVPIRIVSEWMGAKVDWDDKTRKVTLDKKGITIEMTIGNNIIKVNGANKSTDVAPEIYKERTYVPVRFISENFGADVAYYENFGSRFASDNKPLGLIPGINQVVIDDKINEKFFTEKEALTDSIDALKKSYEIVSKKTTLDDATALNYNNSIKNMKVIRSVSRYYILSGYQDIYNFIYDKYTGDIYKINFVQTQTIIKFNLNDESNFWLAG